MSTEPRELTAHEREVATQREAQLRELQAAAPSMLAEIRERLGFEGEGPGPEALEVHLTGLGETLLTDPLQRVWWLTRLGVWVARYLADAHDGQWALDRDPQSRTFLRPVVGGFAGRVDGPRYDPMQVAAAALDGGESLSELLEDIAAEIGK